MFSLQAELEKLLFMIKRLLFTAITLLCVLFTFAQETTSDIQGIITDNGKVGLAGATVTALHIPTGTRYTTTTRKDGRFNLAGLRVGGPYVLSVTYVGFREEKHENIFFVIGQDFTMRTLPWLPSPMTCPRS